MDVRDRRGVVASRGTTTADVDRDEFVDRGRRSSSDDSYVVLHPLAALVARGEKLVDLMAFGYLSESLPGLTKTRGV